MTKPKRKPNKLNYTRVIGLRIRPQFINTHHGALMFGVIMQAVHDLLAPPPVKPRRWTKYGRTQHENAVSIWEMDRTSARMYLAGEMIHAEQAGADSAWIKESIDKILERRI